MIYFLDSEIEQLIKDDVPYSDLTTDILGIDGDCQVDFIARDEIVVCATQEAKSIFQKFGIEVSSIKPTGYFAKKNEVILSALGRFSDVQQCYRICSNLIEHASGIATKAKRFVDLAKSVNPNIRIATTRKNFPFAKKLVIKAVLAGGACVHRLGLSETILIFKEHIQFFGGFARFLEKINQIKQKAYDKMICVEVINMEQAQKIAKYIDVIQLDKFSIEDTKKCVELKAENPNLRISVAGGINNENVVLYAQTGIDAIATSWLYFSKPADIGARFIKI